jgi:hypothetical protein
MENAFGNQAEKVPVTPGGALKCHLCGAALRDADEFCGECGARAKEAPLHGADKLWSDEVEASVKKASKWILAIAIMFLVFGTFMGFLQKGATDKALANIGQYQDDMRWSVPVKGKTVTVAELRRMIHFEYYAVFAMNYFLGLVMFAIFFWSKKSPFSAFVTAMAVYLGVIVLNTVVDPKTILQGLIVKVAVIAALTNGIKAAIPTRGLARGRA